MNYGKNKKVLKGEKKVKVNKNHKKIIEKL